jgi:N-acetylglucosamine kinase-like BadF-type ATPase
LEGAVALALASAGARRGDLAAATFSLAGADWAEDFVFLASSLEPCVGPQAALTIVNDSVGAIRCGTPDAVGVSVVAGTYSAVGARGRDGGIYHLGFWPDGAGAYFLGRRALRFVYRAGLGIGPRTSLSERAFGLFDVSDSTELLHSFTRRGGRADLDAALLASVVLDEAEAGDAVALSIVADEIDVLSSYARVAAARVQLPRPYPLVLAGGVFRHATTLLADGIGAAVPDGAIVRPTLEPAAGALLLAFDERGADPAVEARVRETLPDPSLFATR